MKHSHSNNNGKLGRSILIAVLVALFILFIALAAVGIFGTKEQFARAKDLLPIVVSLITQKSVTGCRLLVTVSKSPQSSPIDLGFGQ